MARTARLDARETLHHVMARGIERCAIFRDDLDRDEFLRRLARLAQDGAFEVFAWSLMPNHFHLLLRTHLAPLSNAMRSLLTGHALWFNRRHGRVGHLFQNRYKSIVCEEEAYFLELVRYIHLNPLRAGVVASLAELDTHEYSGHSCVIGTVSRPWQQSSAVLRQFADDSDSARDAYRRFVHDGASQGARKDLMGGGLRRSAAGWKEVAHLRRGRECFTQDERVLGRPRFVESLLRKEGRRTDRDNSEIQLDEVIVRVCRDTGITPDELIASNRPRGVTRAREGIAFLWIVYLRRSGHELAARLNVAPSSAYRCAQRGEQSRERWCQLLDG
jgi:putative transposase